MYRMGDLAGIDAARGLAPRLMMALGVQQSAASSAKQPDKETLDEAGFLSRRLEHFVRVASGRLYGSRFFIAATAAQPPAHKRPLLANG